MEEEAMPLKRLPNSSSISLLPDELMADILSLLPVKQLLQLRCVNKYFKALISDPSFVQIHLNKSARKPNLAVIQRENIREDRDSRFVVTLSIPVLLSKRFTRFQDDLYHPLNDNFHVHGVIGSCNGLICLNCDSCLCFWNPATRTKYANFSLYSSFHYQFNFSFGYDNLTRTYKVVAFFVEIEFDCKPKSIVKIFSLGDNSWRDIQCFPVPPLYWFHKEKNNGVYLNGTINWLALSNYFGLSYACSLFDDVTAEQYGIVSLDLSSESYTQIMLPSGFDEVQRVQPTLAVLRNCLCFSHVFKGNQFVIWQMKDFGVQESWIQLFKISYPRLEWLPLYLYENGYKLILATNNKVPAFSYNCRDQILEEIRFTNQNWLLSANEYIESLVPAS